MKEIKTLAISLDKYQKKVKPTENELLIETQSLQKELEHYCWRKNTQSPVIKILSVDTLLKQIRFTHLSVQTESVKATLCQFTQIPLFKIVYLIKQACIGYQRLCSRFGKLSLKPQMIAINADFKCKVWLNSDFKSNIPQFKEDQFNIQHLIYLFQQRTAKSIKSQILFNRLKNSNNVFSVLNIVRAFNIQNNIVIASRFQYKNKNLSNNNVSSLSLNKSVNCSINISYLNRESCPRETHKLNDKQGFKKEGGNSNCITMPTNQSQSIAEKQFSAHKLTQRLQRSFNKNQYEQYEQQKQLQSVKSNFQIGINLSNKPWLTQVKKPLVQKKHNFLAASFTIPYQKQSQENITAEQMPKQWLKTKHELTDAKDISKSIYGNEPQRRLDYQNLQFNLLKQIHFKQCETQSEQQESN